MPEPCGKPVDYEHKIYPCSLPAGHSGAHDTWVAQADLEDLPDLSNEREDPR